jgi:hypothetical protein
MSERQHQDQKSNDRVKVKESDSWSIEMSMREQCFYIASLDYHAGPLRLTRADIRTLGKLMAKKSRERRKLVNTRTK